MAARAAFAFALHAKPARAVGAAGADRSFERPPYLASALLGVSVCLEPPVYYLPLSATGGGAEEEGAATMPGGAGGAGGGGSAADCRGR